MNSEKQLHRNRRFSKNKAKESDDRANSNLYPHDHMEEYRANEEIILLRAVILKKDQRKGNDSSRQYKIDEREGSFCNEKES